MNKFFLNLIVLVICGFFQAGLALTPFWYNGIAIDQTGEIIDNQTVNVRISIYVGNALKGTQTFLNVATNQFAGFSVFVDDPFIDNINANANTKIKAEVQAEDGSWIISSVSTISHYQINNYYSMEPSNINLAKDWIIMGNSTNDANALPVGGDLSGSNEGTYASFVIKNDVLTNNHINPLASIEVTKLEGGTEGHYLQTIDGLPTWIALTNNDWSLTGNSGTSPGTNFIGTTDDVDLVFKINNTVAGRLTHAKMNTSFGYEALSQNTTGSSNVAIGTQVLRNNTTGSLNSCLGYSALYNNTIGSSNVAIGTHALYSNTSARNLVAVGDSALFFNTSFYNVAVGSKALFSNTGGSSNTAIGYESLKNNQGGHNTAVGMQTMQSNTTGHSNSAFGYNALLSNLTGNENVAYGENSLRNNTVGRLNSAFGTLSLTRNSNGEGNVAIGYQALIYNSTGNTNTAIGIMSLVNNDIGNDNTALGKYTLNNNISGNDNFASGSRALYSNMVV